MEVILIEKIDRLGDIGDTVVVKNGFARNYLIPRDKALRATAENQAYFEKEKKEILARNEKIKEEAKKVYDKINNKSVIIISHASDEGRLYGSVMTKDIAEKIVENFKADIKKSQIILLKSIREIGIVEIKVRIHADYVASVKVNVARSMEEAKENLKPKKKADAQPKAELSSVESKTIDSEQKESHPDNKEQQV